MNQEMQAMIAEMEDIKHIKKTLTSWLKEETNIGKECFDTKSCGEVSDIIKDMAEATKYCYEACYYKTVVEAMSEGVESSYGYNHWHKDNGDFASRGRGRYISGFTHGPYMDQEPYIDAYMNDPDFRSNMMGYSSSSNSGGGRSSRGGNSGGRSNSSSNSSSNNGNSSMGYDSRNSMGGSRDGEIYDSYRDAKRHYQSSNSSKDKAKMEEHCMKYMENTLNNLRSMWKDADPMLKARVKKDFGEDMAEMLEEM